ncbi:MAG: HdeD family acid-resistance protein [Halobacteriota archaeon]
MVEEKTSGWLRIAEIIVGLIVIVLGGYAIAYPGVTLATLIALLAFGLLILSAVEFVRIFSTGISGWQRLLNLILSVIVFLIALVILVYPLIAGAIVLGWLVAIALIIAGAMFISRGSVGMAILGVIVLIIGFWALFFPAVGGLALVVLLAIGLIILGLELVIAGLLGRWTF